jgi:HEAT repeat protein
MKNPSISFALIVFSLVTLAGSPGARADERAVRDAVKVARTLFKSDNMFDQICGAGTLVDIGDKEALQFLADYMNHDDWSVQRSAIDMMLSVQHPTALDVIYRMSELRHTGVFMKFLSESIASKPRADMGEFLMSALGFDDAWVRKFALQALAAIPLDDKEARITAFIEDESTDPVSRAYGYYVLMYTPSREAALAKLLEIAEGSNDQAQEGAAVGLGLVDTDATKGALKKLQTTSTPTVKIAALASSAGLGDEDAIAELIDIVVNGIGLDSSVAAASLRRMPADIAVRISETLMNTYELSSDAATRLIESWAWIEADPSKVYDWGLNNENPDIRMQTIWLIGQRDEQTYLKALVPLLKNDDSGVRCMASWSIIRLLGDEYDPGVET